MTEHSYIKTFEGRGDCSCGELLYASREEHAAHVNTFAVPVHLMEEPANLELFKGKLADPIERTLSRTHLAVWVAGMLFVLGCILYSVIHG